MSDATELPENMVTLKSTERHWNGVHVALNEFTCSGRVLFHMAQHEEATRFGVLLDEVGDHCETRLSANAPCQRDYRPRHMYFAPAEMALWGYSADTRYVKCAAISFDMEALNERLELSHALGLASVPRIRFVDDPLWTLTRLLTEAIDDPDPSSQLYGDSLVAAMASRLFERPKETKTGAPGLSPTQLKEAMSFLDAQLPDRVELAALAELAGLSQSHYNRAFKASTGMSPYQWQLHARIERAKDLLMNSCRSLDSVAAATGFADAVHFGRVFRKLTGATPAAWRMDRLT